MNCGTFQIQRIAAAVADVMKTFEPKYCGDCRQPIEILNLLAALKITPASTLKGAAARGRVPAFARHT